MRRGLAVFVFLFAMMVRPASAQVADVSIYYSGQIDGFSGSAATCPGPDCAKALATAIRGLKRPSSILIGMGDNFAPDPNNDFPAQMDVKQRTDPQFNAHNLRVIDFLDDAGYDAVVPGAQDFLFGANFLQRSADKVNMVATNLVRNPVQVTTCPAYPQLPAVTILLPNQVSSSIASGSSPSAAGSAGGGGGGGGGKKGGKKGGGGGAAASPAGGAAGGGGAGGVAPGACDPQADAELHKKNDNTAHPAPKIQWPDAKSIYPWTGEIGLDEDSSQIHNSVFLCPPEDPSLSTHKKLSPHQDPDQCAEYRADPAQAKRVYRILDSAKLGVIASGFILPNRSHTGFQLLAGSTDRICFIDLTAKPDELNHYCSTIKVQEPMFSYAWRVPPGTKFVILGALAPDTLNGLSRIDTSWWYKDQSQKKVTRQAAVNDPASAIQQALYAFDLLNPREDKSIGVLLAQMPPSEAKALADSLSESVSEKSGRAVTSRIGLIFSAADLAESSPKLSVDIENPIQNRVNADDPYFIPVLTPNPVFQQKDCLAAPAKYPTACLSKVTFSLAAAPEPVPVPVPMKNDPPRALNYLKNSQPPVKAWATPFCADQKNATGTAGWECAVLGRMLKDVSANPSLGNSSDIAILEEKDFDFARIGWDEHPTVVPDLEDATRILWKAGRLARVSLLGSTLETLLDQEDKVQTRSFQTLPLSRSLQQLKILGITKVMTNEGKVYFINGMPLSESLTYSVATTDRLANSTSDFSQLGQMDLDLPSLFPARGRTVQIADIALKPPTGAAAPANVHLYLESELEGVELEAAGKDKAPTAKKPSFSYSNRTIENEVAGKKSKDGGAKQIEKISQVEWDKQLRPMVRWTLAQAAFSYSAATPNQGDPSIANNFGGVSNPNVSSAFSQSVSALQNMRFEWYPAHSRLTRFEDIGIDDLVNFTEGIQGSLALPSATPTMTTTGALVPERIKSLTANNVTLSPFLEFQAPKWPIWKALVVREIASDNIAQPVPQYLPGCMEGSPLTFISDGTTVKTTCDLNALKDDFQFSLKRNWTLGTSIGTRIEKNDFAYAEIGFTHQRTHDVLNAVGVVNAGTNHLSYFCSLIGNQSLTICAGNMPAEMNVLLVPSYSNYSQEGGYLLGLWTVPVAQRVVFQGSGFGNFFAYGNKDQSVLTHYAFNAMGTLLVNLPANFSVGPTWNEFFFQDNARHAIGTSLIRRTVGAQLNYNFDWHTGVSAKAFYGNTQ
jgi:hypothetical protein